VWKRAASCIIYRVWTSWGFGSEPCWSKAGSEPFWCQFNAHYLGIVSKQVLWKVTLGHRWAGYWTHRPCMCVANWIGKHCLSGQLTMTNILLACPLPTVCHLSCSGGWGWATAQWTHTRWRQRPATTWNAAILCAFYPVYNCSLFNGWSA